MPATSPAVSPFNRVPWRSVGVLLTLVTLLAACGGGGGDSPSQVNPPPPPVVNQAPMPRFDAPTAVVAGQAAVFDARASTDPEGSALRFTWDFGDGSAAGTAQVAHLYPAAGTYTAKLLVSDEQGAEAELTRTITVSAAPVAARSVPLAGRVTGIDGQPLVGVAVTVQGHSGAGSSATSDGDGRVVLSAGVGVNVVLRLSKAGYTDQIKALTLPAVVGSDGSFEASLMPRAAALTLADAAVGGTVTGADGASLVLPAGALVDASTGAPISGPVQITMTPVDINAAAVAAFPGRFEGFNPDGSRSPIVSFGTTEFLLSQAGRPLQLKSGVRARIDLPVYASQDLGGATLAAGASLPLWSLDERSAQWVNEGQGTLVASAASPTGLALRADVGHFSWWNADKGYTPYRPKPRCINDVPGQYDSIFEQATICKMLAEMDKPIPAQGSSGVPGRALALAARPAAAASAPRFPFPAVRVEGAVPMSGGVSIDIPPDSDVVLTGTALNGTWRGQTKIKGGQGATADVNIPLRPVLSGGLAEVITLPFDSVRAAQATFRVDTYRFTAPVGQVLTLSVAANLSNLTGRIRLRNAAGDLLDGASFGVAEGSLRVVLPAAGEYRVEVEAGSGAPGAYRLQAALAAAPSGPATPVGTEGAELRAPMVVAHQGKLLALWMAPDASNNPQLVGMRGTGQTWATPQRLAPALGFIASAMPPPHAVADGTGTAWVLWFDAVNKVPMVTRGALAAETAWSEPLALASSVCPGTGVQRLAVNAQGQAVAMWQRAGTSAGQNNGWCTRRFEGGTWGSEQVLSPVAGHNFASTALQLVLTDAGQAVAAWNKNGVSVPLVAQQDAAGQAWTPPVEMDAAANEPLPTGASWNALAAAADGTLVMTWRNRGAGPFNSSLVYAAVRPAGQAWSARVALGESPSSGFGHPQVGWLGAGRFAVAWNDPSSGPRLREYDSGSGWAAPQTLAGSAASPLTTVMWNLATANDGSAAVVSQGQSGSAAGFHLFLDLRHPVTGSWRSASTNPSPSLVSGAYGPPVAVDAGWAGLVWLQTASAGFQVRALGLPTAP